MRPPETPRDSNAELYEGPAATLGTLTIGATTYRIEPGSIARIPYELVGPRKTRYYLMRCLDKNHQPGIQLFVTGSDRSRLMGGALSRFRFTDKNGPLELLR
jgi:hypothetical protein